MLSVDDSGREIVHVWIQSIYCNNAQKSEVH